MDRVEALTNWRRPGREVVKHEHTEHTREVVRQELPEDLRTLILENANIATQQTLRLAELERRVADLERALGDIAREALAKARQALAKASEAA